MTDLKFLWISRGLNQLTLEMPQVFSTVMKNDIAVLDKLVESQRNMPNIIVSFDHLMAQIH